MKLFAASLLVLFTIGYVQADETFTYEFTCVSGGSDSTAAACNVDGEGADAAAAEVAAKALAFCNSPDNDVVDNEYATYGCGACETDAVGTCDQCAAYDAINDAAANDCNTYADPQIGWKCSKNGTETECTGTEISCFGPSDTYDAEAEGADATLVAGGCGVCDASYDAADCTACNTDMCNNAVRVASIMGPLLALFFWLH